MSASLPSRLVAHRMPPGDLVVGPVLGESLAEPAVPHRRPAGAEVVRPLHRIDVAAGDVEIAGGPERGVHRVGEQGVDLPRSLVGRPVVEEGADLVGRGQRADDVERDAAEELGVGRRPRGRDPQGRGAWRRPRGRSRSEAGASGMSTTRPVGTVTRADASSPRYDAIRAVSPRPEAADPAAGEDSGHGVVLRRGGRRTG